MIEMSRIEITTEPILNVLSPNGDVGTRLIGPAFMAVSERKIMAKLMVAIMIEKTGTSFNGLLMV